MRYIMDHMHLYCCVIMKWILWKLCIMNWKWTTGCYRTFYGQMGYILVKNCKSMINCRVGGRGLIGWYVCRTIFSVLCANKIWAGEINSSISPNHVVCVLGYAITLVSFIGLVLAYSNIYYLAYLQWISCGGKRYKCV